MTATNSGGATTATLTIVINAVPTLSYSASTGTTGTVGTAMSITPSTLDANGAPVTNCGIQSGTTALPTYLSVSPTTCVIFGTPTSALSLTTYKLVATNSVGTSSPATVTITVNPAPLTISPLNPSVHQGAVIAFSAAGGVPPYTFLFNPVPGSYDSLSGQVTTTGGFLGTSAGTVTDSAGHTAQTTLTVLLPLPTLSYAVSTGTTGAVGSAMSVTPSTFNPNPSLVACGIQSGTTALPSYLSVNPSTCVISGTPTSILAATIYNIIASNADGSSSPASVTLSVNPSVPALSYGTSTGITGVVGSAMSVTPSTLTANGASITGCGIKGGTTALPGYLLCEKSSKDALH